MIDAKASLPLQSSGGRGAVIRVPGHPSRRLGLIARNGQTRLPRFAAVRAKLGLAPPPPVAFDYRAGLPDALGVLGNDRLGDCAFAGPYHRLQAVTFRTTGVFLAGDALAALAVRFYEEAGGYDPDAPLDADGLNPTDQGGDPDAIARYLVATGMMRPDGTRDRFVTALDVDPTREDDLAFVARECLGIGFGVTMTSAVMPPDGSAPPPVWRSGGSAVGGHYVYAFARDEAGFWTVNSWGSWYRLDPSFIRANLQTATAYVSTDALEDGRTVMGLTLDEWRVAIAPDGRAVA